MLDKIKGSLIGGAVGDALGYAVEFLTAGNIFKKYGEHGITEYDLDCGVALISDDTQMTLFTAEGLLNAQKNYTLPTSDDYIKEIYKSYKDWYKTQGQDGCYGIESDSSALLSDPQLYSDRAPGNTCLSALRSGNCGRIDCKINNSKGCGGVMRIAPIPLLLARDGGLPLADVDMLAARAAAITHGNALGYIPAAFVSHVIGEILLGRDIHTAVEGARTVTRELFCDSTDATEYFDTLIAKAVEYSAETEVDELDAIRQLGEGWVAEETAAIAVYCALRYADDFERAIIASVNHDGDSDSTGAVTGNILGAYLGYSKIPEKFLNNLELSDILTDFSTKLAE